MSCMKSYHQAVRLLCVFIVAFLPLSLKAQLAIPEHGGKWVHDEANVLSPATIANLERVLKADRDSTSNQIAVLILPSLQGQPIEDYSLRVAENWKLGKQDKDNGVLLLISIADRQAKDRDRTGA